MNELLDTQQYADLYGVSRRTVQRWIEQGLVFAAKIGRSYYLDANEEPPHAAYQTGEQNSNVEPITALSQQGKDGLPRETVPREIMPFAPEEPEEEEEDEEDCHDPSEYPAKDLRKAIGFATRDEAEEWAADIPVPTEVFRRCSDGKYQVVVIY